MGAAATSRILLPWGPFSPTALRDHGELTAQLRCLAGIVACHRGSADGLIDLLRDAEADHALLQHAAVLFDQTPALTARRIVSTFGAVNFRRRAP